MRLAAVLGVYNEEENIDKLIESLLNQTVEFHEIVIVDDGSTDRSRSILKDYADKHPKLIYIRQENSGPSVARNAAWKKSTADLCFFTDGDCVPEKNWAEELLRFFESDEIGATGGTYRELPTENLLSKFIGMEITWKYKNVKGEVDVHGTYNLAVRKKVLEEIEGFNETYPDPSGEDWDLAYKISKKHKIIFNPNALVSQKHPEKFWHYLKGQVNRAFYRIKVYKDHPERKKGDTYTSQRIALQMALSGLLLLSLALFYPFFELSFMVPVGIILILVYFSALPFPYFFKRDPRVAFLSIPIQLARNFAWLIGAVAGVIKFGL